MEHVPTPRPPTRMLPFITVTMARIPFVLTMGMRETLVGRR